MNQQKRTFLVFEPENYVLKQPMLGYDYCGDDRTYPDDKAEYQETHIPTDDEIISAAKTLYPRYDLMAGQGTEYSVFVYAARWMRQQILNNKKQ